MVKFKKPIKVVSYVESIDEEGCTTMIYNEVYEIEANVQPESNDITSTQSGTVVNDKRLVFCELDARIKMYDFVHIYEENADYRVIALNVYNTHKTFSIKRIV